MALDPPQHPFNYPSNYAHWVDNDAATRIERKLDRVLSVLRMVLKLEGTFDMATQATLDKLTADVAANTSASQSVAAAFDAIVKSNTDLTDQLKAALAASAVDDPAVLAVAQAIETNNATLAAAIPALTAAVVANTPSA